MTRHFLRDDDLSPREQREVLELALALRDDRFIRTPARRPAAVAVIFDKPSTRTRVSFSVGVAELGGYPLVLDAGDVAARPRRADRGHRAGARPPGAPRSSGARPARTASRRWRPPPASPSSTRSPTSSTRARCSPTCMTVARARGGVGALAGLTLAYLGDGANNMAHSYLLGGATAGLHVRVGGPGGLPARRGGRRATPSAIAAGTGGSVLVTHDPTAAVAGADVHRHRHVGVDGPRGRDGRARRTPFDAVPGQRRAAGARRRRTRSCCTACPPTAARRSPPRCSTARSRWSGTRPRTGCTPRRPCYLAAGAVMSAGTAAGDRGATAPPTKAPASAHRRLLARTAVRSQSELAARSADEGVAVTQATLSRDLVELGAVEGPHADGGRSSTPCPARAATARRAPATTPRLARGSPGCARSCSSRPRRPATSSSCAPRRAPRSSSPRRIDHSVMPERAGHHRRRRHRPGHQQRPGRRPGRRAAVPRPRGWPRRRTREGRHVSKVLTQLPVGERVGIAFSGGLDTSVAVAWMRHHGRSRAPTPRTSASTTSPRSTRCRTARCSTARSSRGRSTARRALVEEGLAALACGAFHIRSGGRSYFNTTPLGRAVTGTLLVRAMQSDDVEIWGDGSTLKGNDIERFYRYGLLANPSLRIYKPWLDKDFVSELGGRTEMSRVPRRARPAVPRQRREGVLDRRQHLGRHARGQDARAARRLASRSSSRSWASGSGTRPWRSRPRT